MVGGEVRQVPLLHRDDFKPEFLRIWRSGNSTKRETMTNIVKWTGLLKFGALCASLVLLLFLNAGVLGAHNLQICKDSDAVNPVTGLFHFDVSRNFSTSLDVAVGTCSAVITNLGFDPIIITEAGVADVILESIVFDASGSTPVSFNVNLNKNSVTLVLPANDTPVIVRFTNGSIPPGGRWTGGGSINPTTQRVTHGFELHCSVNALPNNLEVNWPEATHVRFHLDALTSVTCGTQSGSCNANGSVPFITGTGTGRFDGVSGATIAFTFTDAGEPGVNDFASYVINDAGGTNQLTASGCLEFGNQQFHK